MLHFDELVLMTTDEVTTNGGDCIVRKIEVTKDDGGSDAPPMVEVTQFHLTSWPDHGAPSSSKPLLDLCRTLLTHSAGQNNSSGPLLTHCSAGVGRTGTLLATLMILKQIEVRKETEIDIAAIVRHLREQRPKMVQTMDQYAFIYTCIKDFVNARGKAFKPSTTLHTDIISAQNHNLAYDNQGLEKDDNNSESVKTVPVDDEKFSTSSS